MRLTDLFSNEELRQHEFPVAKGKIFLAHAGVCPLPRRVFEAIQQYASLCTQGDQEILLPAMQMSRARETAARLLRANPAEVAFVGPTSLGLSLIAGAVPFQRDENVIVYFDDYPSNVYPWLALSQRGVNIRFLKTRELGKITPAEILEQIDGQTRLVALASCHFISGYRIDLPQIGNLLRERGILFCVDGIQTLGVFPTDSAHFDFLAADAHKWLLGPCAAGLLFVRRDLQDECPPPVFGWHNVRCPGFIPQKEIVFRRDARRYEAGTQNLLGLVGLQAAMEILLEIGLENVTAELLRKRSWLVPALLEKGFQVLHPDLEPERASSIISFFRPGLNMALLHEKLEQANIITSLRMDRSGQQFIRISPHFYNTDAELNLFLDQLSS